MECEEVDLNYAVKKMESVQLLLKGNEYNAEEGKVLWNV